MVGVYWSALSESEFIVGHLLPLFYHFVKFYYCNKTQCSVTKGKALKRLNTSTACRELSFWDLKSGLKSEIKFKISYFHLPLDFQVRDL